ncbi:MAG: hypothetical protein H6738_13110 [Alphaproteobacteria bacterium]|nr:hypothetical protein [Alphaproteobacteria bacterium]
MKRLSLLLLWSLATAAHAEPTTDQVTLPLDEFLRLYEQGKVRPDRPADAPREFALASAAYDGEVVLEDGEPVSAVLSARFKVENLRKPGFWVRVPLLPAEVAVQSATIGGKDAPVVLENGWYTLVTDQQGAFDVTVRFAAAVATSEGSTGFSFQLAPSGATTLQLAVPATDALDFSVANARLQSDRTVGGRRVVTATLPATGALSVQWQREVAETEKQASRVYSEIHSLVGVGDGLLTAHVTVQDTILFAGIDTLKLQVPKDMTVLGVAGPGLRDWSADDAGLLTVLLNYAAEGSYTLVLDLERVLPPGSDATDVPLVRQVGVERSKGFVGVQSLGNLELRPGTVQGAAPVDVRTLPATLVGITGTPILLGFKYLGDGAAIPLTVDEHEDVDVLVTLLDQAEAQTAFTRDGRRLTSVRYQVRNNRRQYLRLALPDGAELWSASVAGRAVTPARAAEGELLVPLVRSQGVGGELAAFEVRVVYVEGGTPPENGRGRFEASLPLADAPSTWVGWTVMVPSDAKVPKKTRDGTLRRVSWLSRPAAAAQVYSYDEMNAPVQQAAASTLASGALGEGAAPVEVTLPLDGQPLYFEKLLALDERLWVGFDYKGLKR